MHVNHHVVFVGLMASGKTTIGRMVAEQLSRPLRDSDEHIEATTGLTASEYAEAFGLDALHDLEVATLLGALDETDPAVITAAAFTVEVPDCRAALDDQFVVWVYGEPSDLAQRAAEGEHRPLDDDAGAQLREQAKRRHALFASVADLVLDVGEPSELAAQVMSQLPK